MDKLHTHLTIELIESFHNNQLSQEDSLMFLEHISQCTYCASQFAESFDQDKIVKAPLDLKDSILLKAKRRTTANTITSKLSRRKQLFLYSLKVCAAMFGAIIIMISSMSVDLQAVNQQSKNSNQMQMEWIEKINASMQDFTDGMNKQISSFPYSDTAETTDNESQQ